MQSEARARGRDGSSPSILVTGGAGYIGSHICRQLAQVGWLPVTLDNLSSGSRGAVRWGPLVEADLRDAPALDAVFHEHAFFAVIHCAALSRVDASLSEPLECYEVNVLGTLNLLRSMRAHSVEQVVFSSTAAVYGVPDHSPVSECDPVRPINPYGRSKSQVESILDDCADAYGLRAMSLRFFNVAGADSTGLLGETRRPGVQLISKAIDCLLAERAVFDVYGDGYDTPDGTCIRDFVHVEDVSRAHLAALSWLGQNSGHQRVNIGSEVGYSVLEVVNAVEQVSKKSLCYRIVGPRKGDPPEVIACTEKARRLLAWRPQASDLASMIQTAWSWQEKLRKA